MVKRISFNSVSAVILSMLFLALSSGCDSGSTSSPPNTVDLRGLVDLDAPLVGASILVETNSYNGELKITEADDKTSSSGAFEVLDITLSTDFRIVARGGQVGGVPFDGELMADIQDYDESFHLFLKVNLFTTLVARYADLHPEMDIETARSAIKAFLLLPEYCDLVNDMDTNLQFFDPSEFMQEADSSGGIDVFIESLLLELDQGGTHSFPSPPILFESPGGWFSAFVNPFIQKVVKPGVQKIAGAVVSSAAGKLFNSFFSIIFGIDDTSGKLDKIKETLDGMKDDLTQLKEQVKQVMSMLSQLKDLVEKAYWDTTVAPIDSAISTIDSAFGKVNDISVTISGYDLKKLGEKKYKEKISELVEASEKVIGDSITNGAYNAIDIIKNKLIGDNTVNGESILTMYQGILISKILKGEMSYVDAVQKMTNLFANILGWQIKGIHLVADTYLGKMNQPELAETYLLRMHNEVFVPETELYLTVVEQMALSTREGRSIEFLPDVDGPMYWATVLSDAIVNAYQKSASTGKLTTEMADCAKLTARLAFFGKETDVKLFKLENLDDTMNINLEFVRAIYYPTEEDAQFSMIRFTKVFESCDEAFTERYAPHEDEAVYPFYHTMERTVSKESPYGIWNMATWMPNGQTVYRVKNKNSSKFLEVTGPSDWDGAHIQQWEYNGGWNFWWKEDYSTYGTRYSGKDKVMTVAGANMEEGAKIVQWVRVDADHQKWIDLGEGGYSSIADNSLYLSIENGSSAKGANAVLFRLCFGCSIPDHAYWKSVDMGDWYLRRVNGHSVLELEVAGPTTYERESHLQQYPWADWDSQKWKFEYLGNGHYRLISKFSNKCLNVWAEKTDNYAAIKQATCSPVDAQLWRLEPVENGYFRITNKHSDKCLDVDNAEQGKLDGLEVFQMGRDNTTERQKWKVEALSQ